MTGWIPALLKVLNMIRSRRLVSLSACEEPTGQASIYSCSIIHCMSAPKYLPIVGNTHGARSAYGSPDSNTLATREPLGPHS